MNKCFNIETSEKMKDTRKNSKNLKKRKKKFKDFDQKSSNGIFFKLADFGLSFNYHCENMLGFGMNRYLPPEVLNSLNQKKFSKNRSVDFRKYDIFALGKTLIELFSPDYFSKEKTSDRTLNSLCPKNLECVLLRMISKDPSNRPSAETLSDLVQREDFIKMELKESHFMEKVTKEKVAEFVDCWSSSTSDSVDSFWTGPPETTSFFRDFQLSKKIGFDSSEDRIKETKKSKSDICSQTDLLESILDMPSSFSHSKNALQGIGSSPDGETKFDFKFPSFLEFGENF